MKLTDTQALYDSAAYALEQARSGGADEAKVVISESSGLEVDWRDGKLETLTRERDLNLSLSVMRNGSEGSIHISDRSPQAIAAAVSAALDIAHYTEADPDLRLPECEQYATISDDELAALERYDPQLEQWHSDILCEHAATCEAAAREDARIVNSNGASAGHSIAQTVYLTSNGFSLDHRGSRCGVSVSVIAGNDNGQQSDYAHASARHATDLEDASSIGKRAAERAIAALDPQSISSGSYPVLFRHDVAASLIGHLLGALGGRAQYRGLSYLHQALGEQVLPEWLSIDEQPYLPRAMSSSPCDSDGLPAANSAIIEDGRIARYLLSLYSARRLNLPPTGNGGGARNVRLLAEGDNVRSFPELIAGIERGVLITSLMGQGVNQLTGDYSRGASGLWIENGKIAHAVEGITIAANLRDMLGNVRAIGDDIDHNGRIHAPSILLDSMTVAQ
ncbi:hypothetical protein KRX19_04230 [Cardiobacteriaceae bacterium TAE3-ERU3]|nr:hypothetical protein [Cardiobacteriaceae bacterium TAE3-ERU3]